MPQTNPARMDPKRAPQFMDICEKCAHTQNYHLTTKAHSLEGFRKDCWAGGSKESEFCGCPTFVSTWGKRRG